MPIYMSLSFNIAQTNYKSYTSQEDSSVGLNKKPAFDKKTGFYL